MKTETLRLFRLNSANNKFQLTIIMKQMCWNISQYSSWENELREKMRRDESYICSRKALFPHCGFYRIVHWDFKKGKKFLEFFFSNWNFMVRNFFTLKLSRFSVFKVFKLFLVFDSKSKLLGQRESFLIFSGWIFSLIF